jgi:integrase/recombinase XerD
MKNLTIKSEAFQYVEKSFKEWLDILGYAPSTVYQMPNYIRELFYWLENEKKITQINQITTPLIKEHYQNLKYRSNQRRSGALSNNYLNKHLQAFYKFMDYLRQSGRMELPYLEIEREEANPKPIQVLTVEEIKALYQAAEEHPNTPKWEAIAARDKAMLSVFYGCGLRRNEGYHLDLSDINFDRQIIHVRKGKNYKERFVPFNKTNANILQEYIYDYRPYFGNAKELNALFVSVKGYRMETQSMVIRLKLLQQKTDDIELQQKDFALHTLRHSIATHLLAAGMSLEKISRFLGHSSLESTQVYTHLIKKEDEHYL